MNLYIPSNYFKLVGNPRWKRSLFESVSVITQFQCSIWSHFRPLSTPPFNRSHRRPRKAWNSLNVSLDWKSNAVSRGRYEHEGGLSLGEQYCRELSPLQSSNFLHLFTGVNERMLSFLFARRRRRASIENSLLPQFSLERFRASDFFHFLLFLLFLSWSLFFAPFNPAALLVQDSRAKLWINEKQLLAPWRLLIDDSSWIFFGT